MKGTVIIYSTAPNDIARDRVNASDVNSPFAAAFTKAIVRPGAEMRDTFDEVSEGVRLATNGAQEPWIEYTGSVSKFSFADQPLQAVERVPVPPSTDQVEPSGSPRHRNLQPALVPTATPRPAAAESSGEPTRGRGSVGCLMPDGSTQTFGTAAECYAHPGALPVR